MLVRSIQVKNRKLPFIVPEVEVDANSLIGCLEKKTSQKPICSRDCGTRIKSALKVSCHSDLSVQCPLLAMDRDSDFVQDGSPPFFFTISFNHEWSSFCWGKRVNFWMIWHAQFFKYYSKALKKLYPLVACYTRDFSLDLFQGLPQGDFQWISMIEMIMLVFTYVLIKEMIMCISI